MAQVWGNDMYVSANVTPPVAIKGAPDSRGTFLITVAPPAPQAVPPCPRFVSGLVQEQGSVCSRAQALCCQVLGANLPSNPL